MRENFKTSRPVLSIQSKTRRIIYTDDCITIALPQESPGLFLSVIKHIIIQKVL